MEDASKGRGKMTGGKSPVEQLTIRGVVVY
jgi:hypothetical protein